MEGHDSSEDRARVKRFSLKPFTFLAHLKYGLNVVYIGTRWIRVYVPCEAWNTVGRVAVCSYPSEVPILWSR